MMVWWKEEGTDVQEAVGKLAHRIAKMETSNEMRSSTSKSVMQTLFRLRIGTKAEKKERTREYRHENMSGNKRT